MPRGGRREGAGRPPDEDEPRDQTHRVRVTQGALDRWRLAAEAAGESLSEWTRRVLDAAAEKALKKRGGR